MTSLPRLGAIVVGGTGGSGTRVLAGLLAANGMAMPEPRNSAEDWLGLQRFLRLWSKRILTETASLDYRFEDLPRAMRRGIEADLVAAFDGALSDAAASGAVPFGWKNPRSIFVLPALAHFLPRLSFVHLVRDGRDMALSKNDRQNSLYFELLFGEPEPEDPRLASARFWARANLEAMAAGRRLLGARYHLVRFEDACDPASPALPGLVAALGLPRSETAGFFAAPESAGRWRGLPPDEAAAVVAAAGPAALAAFGYA